VAKLNERNVRTARGGTWTHVQAGAILHPFDGASTPAAAWSAESGTNPDKFSPLVVVLLEHRPLSSVAYPLPSGGWGVAPDPISDFEAEKQKKTKRWERKQRESYRSKLEAERNLRDTMQHADGKQSKPNSLQDVDG